jgi:hypothetical protein
LEDVALLSPMTINVLPPRTPRRQDHTLNIDDRL